MDLVIDDKKEDVYKIKVGAEVFKVSYPSWSQAKNIEKELKEAQSTGDQEKVVEFITNTLQELGLDNKFFDLEVVKAKHIFKVWSEVNSIKK